MSVFEQLVSLKPSLQDDMDRTMEELSRHFNQTMDKIILEVAAKWVVDPLSMKLTHVFEIHNASDYYQIEHDVKVVRFTLRYDFTAKPGSALLKHEWMESK